MPKAVNANLLREIAILTTLCVPLSYLGFQAGIQLYHLVFGL